LTTSYISLGFEIETFHSQHSHIQECLGER
jgi:hypothetical protein